MMADEVTPRLIIKESDVRDIESVRKFFEPILINIFGVANIEVIKDGK